MHNGARLRTGLSVSLRSIKNKQICEKKRNVKHIFKRRWNETFNTVIFLNN